MNIVYAQFKSTNNRPVRPEGEHSERLEGSGRAHIKQFFAPSWFEAHKVRTSPRTELSNQYFDKKVLSSSC